MCLPRSERRIFQGCTKHLMAELNIHLKTSGKEASKSQYGIAQNVVQLDSTLSNSKRNKASEIEKEGLFMDKNFARFKRFKLSKPIIVVHGNEDIDTKGMVEKVLGHIV
uniref:Uncharacterized protein n=1 Tax=Rhizophagus irregularis (strain DAOM 181602 / DAOM 197198 / MUCL 43194) TaxID=747089 RepID=U9TXC5_RHIID